MTTICLCGSARYEREFKAASKELTLAGFVVIGLGSYPSENEGEKQWYTPAQKEMLDLVHLAKIIQSDAVLVVDDSAEIVSSGHIGFSTARDILWANMMGVPVHLLSEIDVDGSWATIVSVLNDNKPIDRRDLAMAILTREVGLVTVDKMIGDTAVEAVKELSSETILGGVESATSTEMISIPIDSFNSWRHRLIVVRNTLANPGASRRDRAIELIDDIRVEMKID